MTTTYCFIRKQTWYYRRRIPKEFTVFFNNLQEIRFSLSTKSSFSAMIKAKKVNLLYEELIMALQIETFEQKQKIVKNYMDQIKNILTEGYYSDPSISNKLNPVELRLEQSQCELSLDKGVSHLSPSHIQDLLTSSDIDVKSVDTDSYRQIERLYLREKIDMIEDLLHTINPRAVKRDIQQTSPYSCKTDRYHL